MTGRRRWRCTKCGQRFPFKSDGLAHVRREHPSGGVERVTTPIERGSA